MATLVYPTSLSYKAPWLLDTKQLEELDDVLGKAWERMTAVLDAEIRSLSEEYAEQQSQESPGKTKFNDAFEKKKQRILDTYPFNRRTRKATLELSSGKKLMVKSFSEAREHPELSSDHAVRVNLELECGSSKCSIGLDDYALTVTVNPNTDEMIAIFNSLKSWADRCRQPLWVRVWKGLAPLQWCAFGFVLPMLAYPFASAPDPIKTKRNEEIHQLIDKGIKEEDTTRAIALLLALESGYRPADAPPPPSSKIPGWAWLVFALTLCASVALSITPPSIAIGIGRGQAQVENARRWMKFISVTVPALVGSNIFSPWLVDLVGRFTKS